MRRSESVTFDELAVLCTSPGYVHAIAMFCFRDNVVRFDRELTVEDISHFHTGVGLTRSEISTLIGLLVKRPIDFRLPPPSVMQAYMNGTEQLLQELHEAMSAVWFRDLDPQRIADGFDPFSHGEAMREPIFYGPESAYNFQYRDLTPKKYSADNDWIIENKGFSIHIAREVIHALGAMQLDTLRETVERLRTKPPQNWTMLPAFTFTAHELAQRSGVDVALVEGLLAAFSLPTGNVNAEFRSLSDFNVANAAPLLPLDQKQFILSALQFVGGAIRSAVLLDGG